MATSENARNKRFREVPFNYALLKLVHHEVGNGLAVLSGYRHRLQRSILTPEQEVCPPPQDVWQDRKEH